MKSLSQNKTFGGILSIHTHRAVTTDCEMTFSVFVPQGEGPFPVMLWLSGLTCTHDNFTTKAGAYRAASEAGMIIVAPDTSPRGDGVADDPDGAYDFGIGAGFYINATKSPFATHYQMEDYIAQELIDLIAQHFPADKTRLCVSGHSMGGHGALTLGLKYPALFKSITAFSPIVAPSQVPWGQKAFSGYLGDDKTEWQKHDATALMKAAGDRSAEPEILIDQGTADQFLEEQLKPELFAESCRKAGQKLTLRMMDGYDHSYYFISTFIDDHIFWHRERLA